MNRLIKNRPLYKTELRKLRINHLLLASLFFLLSACAAGCQPATSTSSQPTVIILTSGPTDPSDRPDPTGLNGQDPQLVTDYGDFDQGGKLELPAGQWLDTNASSRLSLVRDLTVTSAGPGSPTLVQTLPDQPVLSLENCTKITFRRIRFATTDEAGSLPAALVELSNCRDIVFENCEFFGAPAAALLLDSSENIRLQDCVFYDNAGPPLKSGDSWQPSQIRCSNCLFEFAGSGVLELNLRASRFDDCEWIGQGGYPVPISGQDDSLVDLLAGTLAAELVEFSDTAGNISLRANTFSSDEIYKLYSRLATDLPRLIPASLAGWSISGQKSEEALPGSPLDPTLGLRLALWTATDEAPAPLYSQERLADDLGLLGDLAGAIDPLLSAGDLEIMFFDQAGRDLLELTLPIADLAGLLEDFSNPALLDRGRLVLLQKGLEPDLFLTRGSGQITALDLEEKLMTGLCLEPEPQLLYPAEGTCIISSSLEYIATEVGEVATIHNFQVEVAQVPANQETGQPAAETGKNFTFDFATDAASLDCWLKTASGPVPFILPDLDLCPVLEDLLDGPLELPGPAGEMIQLQPAVAFAEGHFGLPAFLLVQEEDWYTIQTILFTADCQMRLVQLDLVRAENGWELAGGKALP